MEQLSTEKMPRPVVREAVAGDIENLVKLGQAMHAESSYSFLPYDSDKARAVVKRWIMAADHVLFIAELDDIPVGGIALVLSEYMFCRERVVSDLLIYVTPGRRGNGVASALIARGRHWALQAGARELCLGVSTGVHSARTGMLYETLGFRSVGAIYKEKL